MDSILWTLVFVTVGILVSLISMFMFSVLTRTDVLSRAMTGNHTAARLISGLLISNGVILAMSYFQHAGLVQALSAAGSGIVLNLLGYFGWEVATPVWSLKHAVTNDNEAVGKVLQAWFLTVGLIIAGAIATP